MKHASHGSHFRSHKSKKSKTNLKYIFMVTIYYFHGFFCFLAAFFKVLSSRSIKFVLSKNNYECFLNFIVQLCSFSFVSNLFSPFIFTLFFPAFIYNNLCIKTTLHLVTLVSQKTGDKTKNIACIVVL